MNAGKQVVRLRKKIGSRTQRGLVTPAGKDHATDVAAPEQITRESENAARRYVDEAGRY